MSARRRQRWVKKTTTIHSSIHRAVTNSADPSGFKIGNNQSENLSKYWNQPFSQSNKYSTNNNLECDIQQIFDKQCKYVPNYFDDPSHSIFNELRGDIVAYHQ